MLDTDVFVSGGGLAGLTFALAAAHAGRTVIVADPVPPSQSSDIRSTAILQPARELLQSIDAWEAIGPLATSLDVLRVGDCDGDPPVIRTVRSFASSDLGDAPFGWNIPNIATRLALIKLLEAHPKATILQTAFRRILARDDSARVTLQDGTKVLCKLAVAADGRTSALRDAANIAVDTVRYGQKAVVCAVTHELPHDNVSTELYLAGGAFTLVPMPDVDGKPASAIVWMNDGPSAAKLAGASASEFSTAATERSCHVLGALTLATERSVWPVITQTARSLTSRRVALIAEAAHVMPPIGAQGLNTSLHDVRALVDAFRNAEDVGAPDVLSTFERARKGDIHRRSQAIDLFNRLCKSGAPVAHALRRVGLGLTYDIAPIRTTIMRAGLGAK